VFPGRGRDEFYRRTPRVGRANGCVPAGVLRPVRLRRETGIPSFDPPGPQTVPVLSLFVHPDTAPRDRLGHEEARLTPECPRAQYRSSLSSRGRDRRTDPANLADDGRSTTVVESHEPTAHSAPESDLTTVVVGDAVSPDTLEKVPMKRTDAFAALTGDTNANVAACPTRRLRQRPDSRSVRWTFV
jgi:hypothetical protein